MPRKKNKRKERQAARRKAEAPRDKKRLVGVIAHPGASSLTLYGLLAGSLYRHADTAKRTPEGE